MSYDSKQETIAHREKVKDFMYNLANEIIRRADKHDESKLQEPEKAIFDKFTPKLRKTTYMSPEYQKYLKEMGHALGHHYANNRHHPEHFRNGICDMNLLDLLEMICDWKAATMRHADGNIRKSINENQARFGYSAEIAMIFRNTVDILDDSRM